MMDVRAMQRLLETEYNIHSEAELFDAIEKSKGIDLGIFTVKFERKDDEKK